MLREPQDRWEPLDAPSLVRRFRLAQEPPVRVLVGDGAAARRAGAHHAALDGLGLVSVLRARLGGPLPVPGITCPDSPQRVLPDAAAAAAAVAAAAARPAFALSVEADRDLLGVGGPAGAGYGSSHRLVDLRPRERVEPALGARGVRGRRRGRQPTAG